MLLSSYFNFYRTGKKFVSALCAKNIKLLKFSEHEIASSVSISVRVCVFPASLNYNYVCYVSRKQRHQAVCLI